MQNNGNKPLHRGGMAANVAMLLGLSVLWGSAYFFVKIGLESIPPLTLTFGRVLTAAVILVTYVFIRHGVFFKNKTLRFWGNAIAASITGMVLPFCLIAIGMQTVESAVAAIIIATVPLFTLPLAHFLTHDEQTHRRAILGVMIGFLGVVLLFVRDHQGGSTAIGIALILGASFSYALSSLVIKRGRANHPDIFGAAMVICGTALLAPIALVHDHSWILNPTTPSIIAVLVLGTFPTAIATLLLVRLINRAGATFASLTNYLIPLVGVTLGIIFLDEKLPGTTLAGSLLIIAGIYLSRPKLRK